MDITDIGHKVENGGVSAQGKLSAEEFNTILDKVVELMTLGGHDDMNAGVDGVATDDVALVKRAGTNKWQTMKLSDILGGVDVSQKFGDASYEDGVISFLDEPGGTVLQTVTLSGTIYNINIATNVAQVFSVLTGDEHKIITITPSTTAGSLGQTPEDFPEGYSYTVAIDTGSGFVNRFAGNIPVGGSDSFDIRSLLVIGQNRIRITCTGNESGATRTRILTATLTNLALSVNHQWQTPWMQGNDYAIQGINFQGNIPKTLHVKVGSTELTKDYRAAEAFPTIPTSYTLYSTDFPELETSGVLPVEMWMTGESVTTPHIFMNIMCINTNDTTPVVCINEVADAAVNFTQGTLFKYAVYGADSVQISSVVIANGTYILPAQVASVVPGTQYTFATSLEVETEEENGTLTSTVTPFNGSIQGSQSSVTLPLDNSHAFLATSGAKFYMNAALRANTEADRETWKNTAQNAQTALYPAVMTGFTYSKDAWATDPDGHRAFVVPARCQCVVTDLKPFAAGGMIGTTGITIEMLIRSSNIGDYDSPVLTIMNSTGTEGLKLYPTKVLMLGTTEQSEVLQEVGMCEDVMTHVVVVLQKAYGGDASKNLCSIYLNGIPNVTFSFSAGSTFGNGSLTIGQERTDFNLYLMRIYDKALDGQMVKANMLNAFMDGVLFDREEKRAKDAIYEGSSISYQHVKNLGYNIMVIDPHDDTKDIPSFDNKITLDCTVRFEYWSRPAWNVQLDNVPLDGQGTTSKQYFRWNLRGKLNDEKRDSGGTITTHATVWTYADGTVAYGKKGYMDGGSPSSSDHPHSQIDRFTAKKNVASMPQGHKMGATALYDDLFAEVGLKDELPDSSLRVAVWQRPFFGFRKWENGEYEYIGLYTAGPDKGCKTTFGYNKTLYPAAMCIEGPNHNPRGTRFLHPWVDVDYDYSNETLTFGGQEGWDCDYCKFETDKAADQASVLALYVAEWKPAYDFVYHCSPYIESLSAALTEGGYADIAAVNADLVNFNASTTNGVKNSLLSFYDENYDIWYYRNLTGQFEKLVRQDGDSQDGLWNILTYLSGYLTTSTPTTAQIRAARTAKFKAELGNYFSVGQTLFHKAFCLLIGAKDNDAKNTYPQKHLALANGGRWGWKQDDLDSIFGVDNNGQSTVDYWVEPGDKSGNGVELFQGCDSAFWYHIWIAYQDELKSMFEDIEDACVAIARRRNILGSQTYETVINVLEAYFFGDSALYFPMTAYQEDRTWTYITPWVLDPSKAYNGVYPLTQAIGDRYLDERYWIERRVIYLFSKYRLGSFTGESAGLSPMAFTPAQPFTFHLVPAMAHYPTANIGGGSGDDKQDGRTFPTETSDIEVQSDGATTVYLKATDWLSYLGDLCGLVLTSRGGSDIISFSVVSKRMRKLKVGDAVASNVAFNAALLSVSGPCMEEIDARNVVSLRGLVDLTSCPRLKKALFSGCDCTISLPAGSRVEEVSFPNTLTSLVLHSLVYLTTQNLSLPQSALSTIVNYYFENCPNINPLAVLESILNEDGNQLLYLTIIITGNPEVTQNEISALYAVATGDYYRLDYQDGAVVPTQQPARVQGTVHINGLFEFEYYAIYYAFPELTIQYNKLYMKFEDDEVWRICCINWGDYQEVVTAISGDTTTITTTHVSMLNTTATRGVSQVTTRPTEEGDVAGTVKNPVGITREQCAAVSSLGTVLQGGHYVGFKEFESFTHSVDMTGIVRNVTIDGTLICPWNVTGTGSYVSSNFICDKFVLSEGFSGTFHWTFFYNMTVGHIVFPSTVPIIPNVSHAGFNTTLKIIINGSNVIPTEDQKYYRAAYNIFVYVADGLVDAYRAEESWQTYFNTEKILPISEYED